MKGFDSKILSRDLFERLFENAEEGIAIVDVKGNILWVNPVFTNIYGYSEEELEGLHISKLSCKEDYADNFLEQHLDKLYQRGGAKFEEVINLRKDGSKITVDVSYTLIKDEEGNYTCGLIIVRDISMKKRLEQKLKESEERYRNLFDTANEGIVIADKNNKIVNVNKRAAEILGYEQDELLGKPATIIMPARYQQVDENALRRILTTGESYTRGKVFEIGVLRKDGVEIPAEATYSVLKMGESFIFTMIFRDITERKNLENRLIQSERLNALGDMARGVAHDFNNLLATILGRVQLLKIKLGMEQDIEKRDFKKYLLDGLEVVERTALEGAKVVKRIQDFTQVSSEIPILSEIQVNELVEDIIEYVKPKLKETKVSLGREIKILPKLSPELSPVNGNPSELREVLLNIINNSIDAMPEGGVITIETSWGEGFILLTIKDTGIGMSESVKGRVFDPFFTTKGPKSAGLGMSVSFGIIKRHHGEITVESEEGRGTSVTIKLPISQIKESQQEVSSHPQTETEKRVKILVIDDEEGVRNLLQELFETEGYEVAIASDGEEGLKLFKNGAFDMVFTDLGMPGVSGWEVAKEIKRLNTQTQVMLITGWGVQVDEEEKRAHGVDFVINKPFNLKEIVNLVQEGNRKTCSR